MLKTPEIIGSKGKVAPSVCVSGLISWTFTLILEDRKLHAQTSTLWTLYAALNESYPIRLRPSGLTSWTFIVNYTHKRPLCGHCAPPLQKPSQSVCTFGLTSWGFIVKLCGTRWIFLENRSIILLRNSAFSLMWKKWNFRNGHYILLQGRVCFAAKRYGNDHCFDLSVQPELL